MEYSENNTIDIETRRIFLSAFPCFSFLSPTQSHELALLMHEVHYAAYEKIVIENDIVDAIYIIVNGEAEVTREFLQRKQKVEVPVAVLRSGEGIGLNDTGFYSATGKRTATVTAMTSILLLRLNVNDLYEFLKKNQLESSMHAASLRMLRMKFIKQSLPFAQLSHERLQWLADHVEDLSIPTSTILFNQGEEGDKCYLIYSGQIEILSKDEQGKERQLVILKSPALFGEATLITHTPRNATAIALEDCKLLMLRHEYLSELIETEDNVSTMFMTLMLDRSMPLRNPHITSHQRKTADGQDLTILKNPDNGNYFKLSKEGEFIWQQLDGKHTMQDITLNLADQFNVFAPNVVAALISKLTRAGYISNLTPYDASKLSSRPLWVRAIVNARRILESRFTFGDADLWVKTLYDKYIRYLFTKLGQIILGIIITMGFVSFAMNTENILAFFSIEHASLFLLFGLIPLSLIEVSLHELGHAFAVKAFGREVHYIGVGWYWFTPIAFTDTSDMWLSTRKPRMLVNLAGVYVDILVAGLSALLILIIPNIYVQSMLWLFSLYTYIGGFRNLSPLQEMDGYYVLMDWVEKPRLRKSAVIWLVKMFPKSLRHPSLFRGYFPEIMYWVACLIYIILISIVTLVLQAFVFNVLEIKANPYLSLILPFLVVLFSCLSIVADIRSQAEE